MLEWSVILLMPTLCLRETTVSMTTKNRTNLLPNPLFSWNVFCPLDSSQLNSEFGRPLLTIVMSTVLDKAQQNAGTGKFLFIPKAK
ncbi:hypothetical protein Aduo_002397 [Ancylostoma duodenale]